MMHWIVKVVGANMQMHRLTIASLLQIKIFFVGPL